MMLDSKSMFPEINLLLFIGLLYVAPPNIMVEWLTLLLLNLEVPVSYLGPETGYPGVFS
jgi:hypothetical protein